MAKRTAFLTLTRREIMRFLGIWKQTILPTWINTALYLAIFGGFIGRVVPNISGFSYLEFIIPGVLMMGVINSAYANNSSSIFMMRWLNYIESMLVSPLSYIEMVGAFIVAGIVRGLMVGVSIYLISLLFYSGHVFNPLLALLVIVMISFVFGCVGILIGLWSDTWDQMNIWSTFLITPLIFLGGVFHSVSNLSGAIATITKMNPIFYMVDLFRYSMLGFSEANLLLDFAVVLAIGAAE